MNMYDKIFPPRVLTLPNGKQVRKPHSRAPLAAVILLALTILSVEVTGFDMGVLALTWGFWSAGSKSFL